MASIDKSRLRSNCTRLLAAVLLVLTAASAGTARAQVFSQQTVLRHFEQFALTTFGPQRASAVVKWDDPGVVLLDGKDITAAERRIVAETVQDLARSTGHDFHIGREGENATILLGFIEPFDAAIEGRYRNVFNKLFADPLRHIELLVKAARSGKANCLYRPAVADFRVIGGIILVRPGLPEPKLRKCLTVFLGKMSGMLGDARKADASIGSGMDEDDEHNRFNALDREIMRLLYLKDLAPGTLRDRALAIVKRQLR